MNENHISRPRRDLPRLRSYNQFPLQYENIPAMTADLTRIAEMGFTNVWVNPLFAPCASMDEIKKEITRGIQSAGIEKRHKRMHSKPGSPYALRNLDINPLMSAHQDKNLDREARRRADYQDIRDYTDQARALGMTPMFDFVMRHVAVDSPLVSDHPHWFKRHDNGNFKFFGRDENYRIHSQSWDDVLEFDYDNLANAKEIIELHLKPMAEIVIKQLGFEGLRIDAAGMIPPHVYDEIIPYIDKLCLEEYANPAIMLGETLGEDVRHFMNVRGYMDYVYNSVYFYPFTQNFWMQDDTSLSHAKGILQGVAPTIGFHGNHDLPRAAEHYMTNKHIRGTVLQARLKNGANDPYIVDQMINLHKSLSDRQAFSPEQIKDLVQKINAIVSEDRFGEAGISQQEIKNLFQAYPPATTQEGKAIFEAIADNIFSIAYLGATVDEYGVTYNGKAGAKAYVSELELIRMLPLNTDKEDLSSRLKQALCFAAFASDGGWFFELGDEWGVTNRTHLFTASPNDLTQRAHTDIDLSSFVVSINETIAQLPGIRNPEWVQRCYLEGERNKDLASFLIHQGEGFTGASHLVVANTSSHTQELSLEDYHQLRLAGGRNEGYGRDNPPVGIYLCGNIDLSPDLKRELETTHTTAVYKTEKSPDRTYAKTCITARSFAAG